MNSTATQARAAAHLAAVTHGTFSAEAYKARQAARRAEATNRPGRTIVWAPR